MPLPDNGASWPPAQFDEPFKHMAICGAWYSGDPDRLGAIYGAPATHNRSSQYRGGIVGMFARWFWGLPTPVGEKTAKLHVPIAEDIAATSADLLFSEPPKFTVSDKATQDRLNEYIELGLHTTLLECSEIAAALGGAYLRIVIDPAVVGRPFLSIVHADAAIPEFSYGNLTAVTFWSILQQENQQIIRHLERHEPGYIFHGLYNGTSDKLGMQIPLTDHPDTATLQPVYRTDVPGLTATYVPNMRPNRLWRDHKDTAPLGRSDYTPGVMSLMDALDETYSSWMRDIDLGKGRVIVPDSYLDSGGPGQGATFDPERRIYQTLSMLPGNGTEPPKITPVQFAIRVDEHSRTSLDLLARIVAGAGYAAQTFGLTSDVAMTATEVHARERRSFITRDRKAQYVTAALRAIIETLLMVDQVTFGTPVTPEAPKIEFGDSVSEDPQHMAQTISLLAAAEAASTETKVRLANPTWDDKQIAAEVAAIGASDMTQKIQGLAQIGGALTSLGTAVQLGTVSQAKADQLVAELTDGMSNGANAAAVS